MFSTYARKVAAIALAGVFAGSIASAAMADTQWDKDHPRRDQVNDRLQNQNKRIHQKVKEGDMSKAKAAKLHREDRAIRKEERRMAARHNGHITKAEQAKLNGQENAVSKQIGQ
jgi:CRISPR/Cas system Type II protein with McrA/HNH and RuvC-like nuclease domain